MNVTINSKAQDKPKLLTARYMTMTLLHFIVNSSFYLVTPVLTTYAVSLGATVTLAGVISGIFSITALLMRPLSGVASNRMRRKILQIVAIALMALSCLCYAAVPMPNLMVFFRILQGVGFALYGTSAVVTISDMVPESRMKEGIAYFGLSQVAASAIGPTLGTAVAEQHSYALSFYVAAGMLLIAMIGFVFLRLDEPDRSQARAKPLALNELLDVKLLKIAVFAGLFSMSNGLNSSFIVLLGQARGIAGVSLYFSVNAACIIIIRLLVSRLVADRTVRQILLATLLLGCCSMALIGYAQTLSMVLIASVFQAAGQGIVQPFIQADCIRRVSPERRGTASSTYLMCMDVMQGLGTIVGGAVVSAYGYNVLYYAMSLVFLACFPLVLRFLSNE